MRKSSSRETGQLEFPSEFETVTEHLESHEFEKRTKELREEGADIFTWGPDKTNSDCRITYRVRRRMIVRLWEGDPEKVAEDYDSKVGF